MNIKNLKINSLLIILMLALIISNSSLIAQNSALSVHLSAKDDYAGNIIMKTLKIPHKTLYTYYCALMWNIGGEGGGYCGMQNHPSGNNFIFSIWDPISSNEPIKAVYTGGGTQVENFGGEGTGLKSWNFELGWAEGNDYQLLSRCWDVGDHTYFGYWVHDISSNNWTHLVTMDYPVKSIKFNTSTGSFLEDWSSTGQNARKVFQKDGYKRRLNNIWEPFNDVNFNINTNDIGAGQRSYNYRNNYDAGVEDGYYYMQSGGATTPSFSGTSTNLTNAFTSSPENEPMEFYITNLTENELSWTVPNSSTPQFKIIVTIGNNVIVDSIITDANSVSIKAAEGNLLRVTIEDVMGNLTTKKMNVGTEDFAPKVPTGLKVEGFGSSDFSVSWDSIKYSNIYQVQIQENFIWRTVDTTSETSYKFTNLEGRTRYRARVCAKNDFGISAFSEYVFAITTVNNEKIISNENWNLIYFDSEEKSGEDGAAKNAIDGDESTYWHTAWSNSVATYPHELQIDLGSTYNLKGFKYLPRQDGGINGTIKEYQLYVSSDGQEWGTPISEGTFEANTNLQEIVYSEVQARYVKFKALSEINGGAWASMAELILVGEIVLDVKENNNELPLKFELNQAYPNPFNPTTTIGFSIPASGKVNLTIYNSLGEIVGVIINEQMQAGKHSIKWNAINQPSGVYYYRLTNENYSSAKKMILVK